MMFNIKQAAGGIDEGMTYRFVNTLSEIEFT
jgi:hypothetical protein